MNHLTDDKRTDNVRLIGRTESGAADVEYIDGKWRLITTGLVQIDQLFGVDKIAGSFSTITAAALSSQIVLTIGTDVYNIPINTADTRAAASAVVSWLNAQSSFYNIYVAIKVQDNAVFYIKSRFWGEYGERANYSTIGSGGTTTTDGYLNFIVRGKPTSLSYDPRDPRVGLLGLSGQVTFVQAPFGDVVYKAALDGATKNMAVDGSVTSVNYRIEAEADYDLVFTEMALLAVCSGIKWGQFLNRTTLPNGILFTVKSDNKTASIPLIKYTEDIQFNFARGGLNFQFYVASNLDNCLGVYKPGAPIPIRRQGSFGPGNDDYIKMTIQDNLSTCNRIEVMGTGYRTIIA